MQHRLAAFVLVLVLVLGLASCSHAEAQDDLHIPSAGDVLAPLFVGAGVLGAVWAGFIVADTVSFAGDTPFDVELAVTDLVLGTLMIGGGITALAFASFVDHGTPGLFGVGAAALAVGSFEVSHGFWSLGAGHHGEAIQPSLSITPTQSGALATVSGAF